MATFAVPPEQIQVEGLRGIAQDLGISADGSRDELIQRIRLSYANKPEPKKKVDLGTKIALVALVISLLPATAGIISVWISFHNLAQSIDAQRKSDENFLKRDNEYLVQQREAIINTNQAVLLYDLIEKNFVDAHFKRGIKFDELIAKFSNEASRLIGVDFQKEDLQPNVIKKALMSLMTSGVIYRNSDLEYYPRLTSFDIDISGCIGHEVAKILFKQNGKLTVKEFEKTLETDLRIKPERIPDLIATLRRNGIIGVDDNEKIVFIYDKPTNSTEPPKASPLPKPDDKKVLRPDSKD